MNPHDRIKHKDGEAFLDVGSFEEMGLYLGGDAKDGIVVRAGQIYEAKTVKGGKNLIVALRYLDGWMYYGHGDKIRKVKGDQFLNAIRHGDLEPKNVKEVDVGRLSMAIIGLDAIANRRTAEQQIQFMGDSAEERFRRGDQ